MMMILRLPFAIGPNLTIPLISRHHRRFARPARLEKLDDTRQTADDVLCLGGLTRDLGDDVAGLDASSAVLDVIIESRAFAIGIW